MSFNSFGRVFRFSTWGESHGAAIGAVVDGCPPGVALSEADIQPWLDKRRPGSSRFTTQRRESDQVEKRNTRPKLLKLIGHLAERSRTASNCRADHAHRARGW